MNLRDYIKNSADDIISAVNEINGKSVRKVKFYSISDDRSSIEFDIATSITESAEDGLGGSIKVLGVNLDANSNNNVNNSHVSRIKFSLNIESDADVEGQKARLSQRESLASRQNNSYH